MIGLGLKLGARRHGHIVIRGAASENIPAFHSSVSLAPLGVPARNRHRTPTDPPPVHKDIDSQEWGGHP